MEHEIGTTAGEVWRYLDKNGPSSITKLKNELKLNPTAIERSIGWLAREHKIREVKKGNNIVFEALL